MGMHAAMAGLDYMQSWEHVNTNSTVSSVIFMGTVATDERFGPDLWVKKYRKTKNKEIYLSFVR